MIQIDMEMPGKCSECRFNIKTGGYSKDGNLVAVDFCSLQYQGYEQGNEDRPEWCPLKEAAAGHWIKKGHNLGDDYIDEKYCCSECGERALVYEFGTHPVCLSKFCPNCGADMREENE